MRTERCEPILPSRNLDEPRAFYGKLGFTAWFQGYNWPDYEIVSRGHLDSVPECDSSALLAQEVSND